MSCSELFKRIFQGCCLLFNYQGSFCFSTAYLFYHIFFSLSRTFFTFFFRFIFESFFILSHPSLFVNIFYIFSNFFVDFQRNKRINKRSYLYKIFQRRGWDSNPRALSDKRFSRPPRYDHFDTSAYLFSNLLCHEQEILYNIFLILSSTFFIFLRKN